MYSQLKIHKNHTRWQHRIAWLLVAVITTTSYVCIADTGLGVGVVRGNQLNPQVQPPALASDPIGLNPFSQHTRSATGLLYPDVQKHPELKLFGDSDWLYSLSGEVGYLATFGDTGTASFLEYGDWSQEPLLNRFAFTAENPQTAHYINGSGGGVARDDQYYRLTFGKYGDYTITVAFDSIPHVFTTNARVLWDGAGSGDLTLPAGLTPGASVLADILSAFQSKGNSTLALERDKASISFNSTPKKQLKLFANGSIEWRDGTRPFGGAFSYPGFGQVTETVEPIDYTTTDINVGLNFSGRRYQANLIYVGSFFRNNIESLVWENPGLSAISFPPTVSFVPERGRFALAPDNDYHNLRGDFATQLPMWRGRVSASVSYNKMQQDSELLPPTIGSGFIGSPATGIDLDLWNGLDALSSKTADAEIDNLLLHMKITMNPMSTLRLSAEFRYQDQDNKTDYTALNPLTGEYGYPALDGGLGAVIPTRSGIFDPTLPGSRVRFRNVPFEKDTKFLAVETNYRLTQKTKLSASYEREETDYSYREVEQVDEDRLRLQLTSRHMGLGTVRVSYEYSDRSGDGYNFNPYEPFYTSSLPEFVAPFADGNVPHTLSALRKYDLADRDAQTIDARVNVIIGDSMDLILSGRYQDEDFDADFGLKNTKTVAANVEWNYQFALNGSLYAYYSYQAHERNIANINDIGPFAADPDPGGAVYPLENVWSEQVDEVNHVLGAGVNVVFDRLTVDFSYTFLYANSKFQYNFSSPAAYLSLFSLAEVGNGFPDQTFRHHLFEGNLRWRFRDNMSLRLLYRYEREDLDDFHYAGLTEPVIGADIFLNAVPENYEAHVIGLLLETNF